MVSNGTDLRCDGCGQKASSEHIARRLRRLEWATRYRPVHVQTLLLGGVAPREDAEFLYAPGGEFRGEAASFLRAVGISFAGKPAESVHAEFQAAGLFLTHILECPVEDGREIGGRGETAGEERFLTPQGFVGNDEGEPADRDNGLLREHLPAVASRIRRSLKPKRVILVAEMPQLLVQNMLSMDLGCPVVLNDGKPFALGSTATDGEISKFRAVLGSMGSVSV